jgi:shikimate kinase
MNIFLTGFMGAGKSTVGELLAARLNTPFLDLDAMIVQRENRTIAEIFATDGEGYFRDCETSTLKALRQQAIAVYATGGGIVERDENRRDMKAIGRILYLKTGWPTLRTRLQQSVDRPLIDPERGWHDVKALWTRRQVFYEDADLIVETDGLTPLEVTEKIASLLEMELTL